MKKKIINKLETPVKPFPGFMYNSCKTVYSNKNFFWNCISEQKKSLNFDLDFLTFLNDVFW